MNFRKKKNSEEPEINFIPLIDVMLVILIFLMATTTYSRFAELRIDLPNAKADQAHADVKIQVAVSADKRFAIGDKEVLYENAEQFARLLKIAAANDPDPIILISADAKAEHEDVIRVMEAARLSGITRIGFATKNKVAENP